MNVTKYFKNGQKVLMRLLPAADAPDRYEALTVFFLGSGPDYLDLALPYRSQNAETYPFAGGTELELSTDSMGVGVRLAGLFRQYLDENLIRVEVVDDVQIFQRRIGRRLDLRVGLRYTKGTGVLRTFREQWEKNVGILDDLDDPGRLPPFPQTAVNLSPGGIRFPVKTPVEVSDLILLILDLGDGAVPLCALAEVVWLAEEERQGRKDAGMRFVSIRQADQKRIERVVRTRAPQAGE